MTGPNDRRRSDHNGAGDREYSARDVGCPVAGEEEEGVGYVLRLRHPAHRDIPDDRLYHLVREHGDHIGAGDARRDGIDAYVVAAELAGKGLRQAVDRELRCRIAATAALAVVADYGAGVDDAAAALLLRSSTT